MTDSREWALLYAAAGWRVYPVRLGTKKALYSGWIKDATTDPELIARQWRRDPYPNIGIVAGEGFAVFDIEAPHLAAFHRYLDRGGHRLPEMPVTGTGRGGIHLYVRPIPDVTTSRRLILDGVHIAEFKTTGGVLAPPSITIGEYGWFWRPDGLAVPEAPGWLSTLIREPARPAVGDRTDHWPDDPAAALDALACAVRDEPEGNRNAILYWAACKAAEEGIRLDIAATVLRRAAVKAGLDGTEIEATIASALGHVEIRA